MNKSTKNLLAILLLAAMCSPVGAQLSAVGHSAETQAEEAAPQAEASGEWRDSVPPSGDYYWFTLPLNRGTISLFVVDASDYLFVEGEEPPDDTRYIYYLDGRYTWEAFKKAGMLWWSIPSNKPQGPKRD